MSNKVTWKKIYEDFKVRHPRLHKSVGHWRPHSYAKILLLFEDGKQGLYDYDTKIVKFTKRVD